MGKVKGERETYEEHIAKVSIPYGKGKANYAKYDRIS